MQGTVARGADRVPGESALLSALSRAQAGADSVELLEVRVHDERTPTGPQFGVGDGREGRFAIYGTSNTPKAMDGSQMTGTWVKVLQDSASGASRRSRATPTPMRPPRPRVKAQGRPSRPPTGRASVVNPAWALALRRDARVQASSRTASSRATTARRTHPSL